MLTLEEIMRYRDCRTPEDFAALDAEIAAQDAAYAAAAAADEERTRAWIEEHGEPSTEEMDEACADQTLRRAALNHRGEP